MAAYLIAEVEVKDPETYEEYRRQVGSTIEKFDGRIIIRGGAIEILEGQWKPRRLVILEFPDMDMLKRWYDSDEYQGLKEIRLRAASSNVMAIQGV